MAGSGVVSARAGKSGRKEGRDLRVSASAAVSKGLACERGRRGGGEAWTSVLSLAGWRGHPELPSFSLGELPSAMEGRVAAGGGIKRGARAGKATFAVAPWGGATWCYSQDGFASHQSEGHGAGSSSTLLLPPCPQPQVSRS